MFGFKKLDQLLAAEIISLTFVLTTSISTIMIMSKLPKYAGFLFSAPHILTSFLMLMLYVLPSILKLTGPVSLLLACAIVVMRMSADRELEAWMSCGVSVMRLCFMPTLLGIGVMLISLASGLFFEPYSNKRFDEFKWLQSKSLVESFIKSNLNEKSFLYDFNGSSHSPLSSDSKLSLYFGKVNSSKTEMENVFMAFSNSIEKYSSLLVAKEGEIRKESTYGYPDYILKLKNGMLYTYQKSRSSLLKLSNKKEKDSVYSFENLEEIKKNISLYPAPLNWTVSQFKSADISLVSFFKDKFKLDSEPQNQMDQLYPKEFLKKLDEEKNNSSDWKRDPGIIDKLCFFIKQISIPLSTVFLPIIGVCLGISDPRKKQISVYFGIGIVIFIMYFSLSVCQQLAQKFIISPYCLFFTTPIILGSLFLFLMRWRLKYPPSCSFLDYLKTDALKLKQIIFRRG